MSGPPPTSVPVDPARAAESNLGTILGVTGAIHALAVITVSLRVYVRIKIVKSPGRDDWTMVGAVICAFGGWLIFVLEGPYGLGRHQDTIAALDLMKLNRVSFWQSIISATAAMALLKISIALNLLRLSPSRWYTWSLWSSIIFVCAYSFMGWMTFFLHCRPMAKHWDLTLPGECYPITLFVTFALINTAFNIFTDVLFASFPIPIIWKLQMKRKVRLYLIGILSLGYLAVVMGILKAVYQIAFSKEQDKTFNQWVQFWGFLQLNIGIIASCAPSLKPIVSKALKLSDYYPSPGSRYGSRGTGGVRTIGGTNPLRSKQEQQHRDGGYPLRDLSDQRSEDELEFGTGGKAGAAGGQGTARSTATVTFYKPGAGYEGDGDRSGSEELILDGRTRANEFRGGILRTTEVTVQ